MNGWLVFLVLLAAYTGLLVWLRGRQGKLAGGFELNGPFVMWRTQWGKRLLERIARPAAFWNVVADFGIVLTFAMGALVFVLVAFLAVYQIKLALAAPAAIAANATPPNYLLGIPGVNPIIPIGYGIVAILLALLIHEGSHGVISYASKMRVKSLGALFFILPIGAFVEPDEEDLERSTTRAKNRVFAAGPTSNIVLALVAGSLLSMVFLSSLSIVNDGHGVVVGATTEGSAAQELGLRVGDVITTVDGKRTDDREAFSRVLDGTGAGQQVTVTWIRDGKPMRGEAVLGDKYEAVQRSAPDANNETNRGKGFLGVGGIGLGTVDNVRNVLQHPFSSVGAFDLYLLYPLGTFSGFIPDVLSPPYTHLFVVSGPLAFLPLPVFFATAAILYWIVWINITLATFNALPMGPLDGGQMFRATLRERLFRRYNVDREKVHVEKAEMGGIKLSGRDEETQHKLDRIQVVVKRTTWTLGFSILGLILVPIIVPYLLRLFF